MLCKLNQNAIIVTLLVAMNPMDDWSYFLSMYLLHKINDFSYTRVRSRLDKLVVTYWRWSGLGKFKVAGWVIKVSSMYKEDFRQIQF